MRPLALRYLPLSLLMVLSTISNPVPVCSQEVVTPEEAQSIVEEVPEGPLTAYRKAPNRFSEQEVRTLLVILALVAIPAIILMFVAKAIASYILSNSSSLGSSEIEREDGYVKPSGRSRRSDNDNFYDIF